MPWMRSGPLVMAFVSLLISSCISWGLLLDSASLFVANMPRDESGRSCRGTLASSASRRLGHPVPTSLFGSTGGRDGGLRSDSMTAPTVSTCEGETF